MQIQSLKPDELRVLLPGARSFFAEGAIPGKLNEEHYLAFFRGLITAGHGMVLAAFDKDGVFLGAIAGTIFPDFATGDISSTECFWYVLPEHRTVGLRLLQAFEDESRRRGCVRIHMIHLANEHAGTLAKLYRRRGYRPLEVAYTKELMKELAPPVVNG